MSKSIPLLPPAPTKPKLIKKNWLEKLILWEDEWEDQAINARRMMKYEQKLQQYQQMLDKILSATEVSLFRERSKQEFLAKTGRAEKTIRDVKRGRYETYFYNALRKYLGDQIHVGLELSQPNGNGYIPDIAYIDDVTGLCIDVEIDEPYSLPDKQPIHYEGEDDSRNEYFNNKGWFVVRFAEEQIAKQTEACCNFLISTIDNIKNENPIISQVTPIAQWSYWEAKNMAENDYRNSY